MCVVFLFKQKTAYEMRISDWSSDVCSSDLWRVEFADNSESTLYLSPQTGELIAKRHDLWRWFDFLWMFHIMDYEERADVNNTLLRVAAPTIAEKPRSEERSVGKEGVSPGRYRW